MKSEIPVYEISNISSFKEDDLLVSRFGPYSKTHTHLHYPHRHNFFHIVLFTEGSGHHSIDFQNFEVKPYQVYFMIPGQVHSWNFNSEVEGYVVNFSGNFFQTFLLSANYLEKFSFFNGSANESVIEIPLEHQQEIVSIFELLLKEVESNEGFTSDFLRVILLKLFISVSRFAFKRSEKEVSAYSYTLLKNYQQLIEKNFLNIRLPKDYADLLYITPNHLNSLCKDLLGISAGEIIRKRIALEAKRLLVNPDYTVNEISFKLNFNDNSYFSKFFKKQVGSSPEEFRKKALKKD